MKSKLLIPLLLLAASTSFGQNCSGLIDSSNLFYDQKNYKQGLVYFKKAVALKCTLNNIHFYNGACIASLAGQPALANQWLLRSVELGYSDTLHMAEDTDLDPIRNMAGYKQVILKIRKDGEAMMKELQALKPETEYYFAVPYCSKGKWGWMHIKTGKALTAARYEFTDFESGRGLYFISRGKGYFWTREGKLQLDKEQDYIEDAAPVGLMDMPQEPEPKKEDGFSEYNGRILSFSDKLQYVSLLTSNYKGRPLGVALNKQGLNAIIRSDGSIQEPFGYTYKQIVTVNRYKDVPLVQLVKEGESLYTLWSLEGQQVFKDPFTERREVSSYDYNPILSRSFYTGLSYGKYMIFTTAKGSLVYSLEKLRPLTGYYDKILMANGRTNDNTRRGSYGNEGISMPYFLVEKKGELFYVDAEGKELRVGKTGVK